MVLLEICLSTTQVVIATFAVIAATAGVTYYLATLGANTLVDCNSQYPTADPIGLAPNDLRTMITAYRDEHLKNDSCSAWFKLSTIQKFACTIENSAKLNCQNLASGRSINPDNLGIRIYFAKNPPASTPTFQMPDDATYGGKTTLVMVPTYRDGLVNRDFDPTQVAATISPDMADVYASGTGTVFALDHANIIPPPWPADISARFSSGSIPPAPYYTSYGTFFLD